MAVVVAVAVAVSGGGAVAVAVAVAGPTKRFFNHIQKEFLIKVWVSRLDIESVTSFCTRDPRDAVIP